MSLSMAIVDTKIKAVPFLTNKTRTTQTKQTCTLNLEGFFFYGKNLHIQSLFVLFFLSMKRVPRVSRSNASLTCLLAIQFSKGTECRISILHSCEPTKLGQKSYLFHASCKCAVLYTQRPGRYGSIPVAGSFYRYRSNHLWLNSFASEEYRRGDCSF